MDKLLQFFPLSARGKKGDVATLIINIVIYIVIAAVLGVLVSILGHIPVVRLFTGILSTLVWIYEVLGIVMSVLRFIGNV